MKNYYLELQGLYKSYFDGSGDHHILKGADLKIEKGEIVAILGSSGSGKSTIIRMIGGFAKPTIGEIIFENNIITPNVMTRQFSRKSFIKNNI